MYLILVLYRRWSNGTVSFRIADFGIARPVPSVGRSGTLGAGTLGYIAPEVENGRGIYNQQADMYSLGRIMLYVNPYQGPSLWTTIHRNLCQTRSRDRWLAHQVRDKA